MERGDGGNKTRGEVATGSELSVKVVPGKQLVLATAPPASRPDVVAVTFDKFVLDCPLCSAPLKPPVFQCGARHIACCGCHAKLTDKRCLTCNPTGGGGFYERNPVLDTFVLAAKVGCPFEPFGCRTSVPYCWIAEHQLVCPHKPSQCPETGCSFLALPSLLLPHLVAQHAWPVTPITFGKLEVITVPAVERRRLLITGAGESVFLLVSVERGDGGRFVSMACVQSSAASGTQYRYKLWTQGPDDPDTGFKDTLLMHCGVRICAAVTGGEAAPAAEEVAVMSVPPSMMHGESKEMVLRVRIEKIRKRNHTQATAAAPASPPRKP